MALSEMIFPANEKPSKLLQWKINEGTTVTTGRVLFLYKNLTPDKNDTTGPEKKFRATQFGKLVKHLVKGNCNIRPGDAVVTVEGCQHPTVIKDLCAECGIDLRQENSGTDTSLPTRASVPMVHSIPELKVTPELAEKIGKEDVERLLRDKKLVLLVDLDQTIVHTTNDRIPADMKDVYHYQLYGPLSPWYHTRLRPHTRQFLLEMSKYYELHICTFGARNYAHKVTSLLDADGVLFSHRILSRDECFDPLSKTANLKALFPCGDDMVCIIDDREDVWQGCGNLIQVKPYHFFRHTGDIHAPPGLGKNEDIVKTENNDNFQNEIETNIENGETPLNTEAKEETSINNENKSGEQSIEKSGEKEENVKEQEEKIEKQTPRFEEKSDESEAKSEKTEEKSEKTEENSEKFEKKSEISEDQAEKSDQLEYKFEDQINENTENVEGDQQQKDKAKEKSEDMNFVDNDDDDYLLYLEDILKRIHHEFYLNLDKETEKGSLKDVIPKVRAKVLKGFHITFSGLIPTHQRLEQSRAFKVATAFGAQVHQDLVDETTHLIAIRPGTVKVNTARKNVKIKIVNPEWLWTCAERWEHVEERLYPLSNKVHGSRIPPAHCGTPDSIVNKKQEKRESFANTINPLLSFSREEIDNMDKEVDEDMEDLDFDDAYDIEDIEGEDNTESEGTDGDNNTDNDNSDSERDYRDKSSRRSAKKTYEEAFDYATYEDGLDQEWTREEEKRMKLDSSSSSSDSVDLVDRFRRGENLPDDLDLGDPSSQASVDDLENDNLEDDREWNAMGAALEREFLSE